MNAIAAREGFAVLYPDQATFANIRRCWNWFEPNTAAGHGECAILLEMINRARDELAVDVARVCVAGMSSGGALAGCSPTTTPKCSPPLRWCIPACRR